MNRDDFWRHLVNSLEIEDTLPDDEEPNKNKELLAKNAAVIRLQMDIYLISPTEGGNKAYMVNGNQLLEDAGVMTIREALQMIKDRSKKKS